MPADFSIVAGDVEPIFTDALTYVNGEKVNLEGATVSFTMRAPTANAPVALTGTTTITQAKEGRVAFQCSAADSANVGNYMASWRVTFGAGQTMTFPTVGYLWVTVQESLLTPGGAQIVSLPELKDYLQIPPQDRAHDVALLRRIETVRPLIENITGPMLPKVYDEKYEGGNNIISLLHSPNHGYGTSPVLNLMAVSEFRGPIEYPLSIIQNPVLGSIYSVELDARLGEITRRTAGGGTIAFQPGRNSIHVVYEAGQSEVPANVHEAACEWIRINYQTTQAVGAGRLTVADTEEGGRPLGFSMPNSVREILEPTRRHPSIA